MIKATIKISPEIQEIIDSVNRYEWVIDPNWSYLSANEVASRQRRQYEKMYGTGDNIIEGTFKVKTPKLTGGDSE